MKKVAVITVSYNHAKFLRAYFVHIARATYPREAWKIFLVDNASKDETVELARTELIDTSRGCTRQGDISAELIVSTVNTGFTGGNNLAMERAMREGFDYVYLLNPDTEVAPDFLEQAVEVAESDPKIGAVQSLMLLAQDTSLVNSWGNEVHFLGFSFAGGYREPVDGAPAARKLVVRDIPATSGAAVMFRSAALRVVGLFDDTIFAYHEDVDLSWRLKLAGFRIVLAPESVIRHRYEFSRSIRKFYFMERNRYWVHVKNLKIPTLLLLLPAFVVMEIGLWFYSIIGGWWREKLRAVLYIFSPKQIVRLMRERRKVQRSRLVSDRVITREFASRILYQEIAHPLWEYFGNYLFAAYWFVVKQLIFW